jgi:hypothetical protein
VTTPPGVVTFSSGDAKSKRKRRRGR